VRKIGSASSPSIQKRGSWGSSKRPQLTLHPNPQLPHHLYRREARGEDRASFLTIYTEEGLVRKSTPCPMAAFSPPYCACPPLCSSVCLRILSLARCRGGRLSCRRVRAPPSGVPGRPPSPPPPCAHVIGLRGRRRGAPSLTAARGFSTIR